MNPCVPLSPLSLARWRRRILAGALATLMVACGGGVGRTGTALACIAQLAGVPADEAVTWVRERYHRRAVETPWQRRYVRRFAGPVE